MTIPMRGPEPELETQRRVDAKTLWSGGAATAMEKRPAIECKVTDVQPEKAGEATPPPAPAACPGTTPLPPPAAGK